ncbi:NTF2-like [Forsythia ovata]|uniref:NTF2-related export protein n=1 Tax=Forsythia ovata TaxID=205694 RepID=A0ABD1QCQ9_9LAMI
MEEQVEMVGRSFVDHYYHLFDNDRCLLASLYRPTSVLTFEGQKTQGVHDISIKLSELPFGRCLHVISTIDSQPSAFAGGVLVFVSGSIQLLGEDYPLRFSQSMEKVSQSVHALGTDSQDIEYEDLQHRKQKLH